MPVIFWDETYPPRQRIDTHLHESSVLFSVNAAVGLHIPGRFIYQGLDQGWSQTSQVEVQSKSIDLKTKNKKVLFHPLANSNVKLLSTLDTFYTWQWISVLNKSYILKRSPQWMHPHVGFGIFFTAFLTQLSHLSGLWAALKPVGFLSTWYCNEDFLHIKWMC